MEWIELREVLTKVRELDELGSDKNVFFKHENWWYPLLEKGLRFDGNGGVETKLFNFSWVGYSGYINLLDIDKSAIVVAEDEAELDWTNTSIVKPDSPYGWLTPEGLFYGCGFEGHESMAELIFKNTEEQLETDGFIKITREPYTCKTVYMIMSDETTITKNQIDWLLLNKHIEPHMWNAQRLEDLK